MGRNLASCVCAVLLAACVARGETTLFDVGPTAPTMPEIDGRYYNDCGTVYTPDAWDSVVVNARDQNNHPTTVDLDVFDWSGESTGLTNTAGVYPPRCEVDWWNYYEGHGAQGLLRFSDLTAPEYELRIHVAYPSDPWIIGSGHFVSQGQSHYWDDPTDGPQVLSFTGLTPVGGQIELECNTWKPAGELRASQIGIEVFELIGLNIPGDLNNDGQVTSEDVDMLWPLFGTSVPCGDPYDLTGDCMITFADAQELVEVVVGTHMADNNLDMSVGILDLGKLATNYNQSGMVFSQGDTNGDGAVGILDLGKLATVYGQSFSPPVPEPASLGLLGGCGWVLLLAQASVLMATESVCGAPRMCR